MTVHVHFSTVADGSMYNRNDMSDAAVIANRRAFIEKSGHTLEKTTRLTFTYQGEEAPYIRYLTLDDSTFGSGMTGDGIPADAIVTTTPGQALFLPVADCIGAVIYDPVHRVLMLSHLGRHSLEQGGALASVEYLTTHFQSVASDLHIWLTAAAGKENYPIWKLNNQGLKEAALAQLRTAGISEGRIIDDPADTTIDHAYYSYSEFLKGNRSEDGDHCVIAWMDEA